MMLTNYDDDDYNSNINQHWQHHDYNDDGYNRNIYV